MTYADRKRSPAVQGRRFEWVPALLALVALSYVSLSALIGLGLFVRFLAGGGL